LSEAYGGQHISVIVEGGSERTRKERKKRIPDVERKLRFDKMATEKIRNPSSLCVPGLFGGSGQDTGDIRGECELAAKKEEVI